MSKQQDANKNNQKSRFLKAEVSKLFLPFAAIVLASVILSIASILIIQQIATPELQEKIQQEQLANIGESASRLVMSRFTLTSERLASLADNPQLQQAVLTYNSEQIADLSKLLQSSFMEGAYFQVIPWTATATVGLRQQGYTLRNNIEALMVTRSGGNRVPSPEVYRHEDAWMVSFAHPVAINGDVRAILLLSFDESFFSNVINSQFYRQNAAIAIVSKGGKNQTIIDNEQKSFGETLVRELPFTNGQLHIASSRNHAEIANPTIVISITSISLMTLLLSLITVLLYRFTHKQLHHDIFALNHYADSVKGLHNISLPKLYFKELGVLTSQLTSMAEQLRSAVTPVMDEIVSSSGATRYVPIQEKIELPPKHIFRAYDIRANAEQELSDIHVYQIGQAIASEALSLNVSSLIVGRDGRLSSDRIFNALCKGISSTGCHVIDIGVVPTPLVYFAAKQSRDKSGVMITASHNGPDDNGFKIVLADQTLHGKQITNLYTRIKEQDVVISKTKGRIEQQDFSVAYQKSIADDILIGRPYKIVLDAQNGVGGELAISLLEQLNCEVIALNCDIDGNFPNHAPDPSKAENLQELITSVTSLNADIGIALDGDADRMVAVSSSGQIASGDQILMLFAEDMVARNPAASVVYDIKCSHYLEKLISQHGGKPIMWKTGHANIKAKMQETDALLGGEFTGHFFFKERWLGFDDGIYATLRLIELLSSNNMTLDEHLQKLPQTVTTPEFTIPIVDDKTKFDIIRQLQHSLHKQYDNLNTLDGVRLDFNYGWGLVRASNTSSTLNARFEANSEAALKKLKELFAAAIHQIDDSLTLPF